MIIDQYKKTIKILNHELDLSSKRVNIIEQKLNFKLC